MTREGASGDPNTLGGRAAQTGFLHVQLSKQLKES